MKITPKVHNYILYAVVALLTVALVVSCVVIHNKNNKIEDIKEKIAANNILIGEEEMNISEIKAQLEDKTKANADLEKKLSEAQAAREKLEAENAKLKKDIANLKAEKQAGVNNLVNNSPQSSTPPTEKICYLTFDDGPSDNTLEILKILKKYNAKATFFVINTKNIDYVKQIHNEGHTIGLHSYTHKYDVIYANSTAYYADLNQISAKVEELTGVKSTVIRFPGGSSNQIKGSCKGIMTFLTKSVLANGYSYFDWNVSSGDAESNNVPYTKIRDNVLSQAKNKNSICVLFHDSAVKTSTVQALPEIIEGLKAQGYTRFEGLTPQSYGYHHKVFN